MTRPRGSASSHPSVRKYAEHVNPAFVKLLGLFGYGRVFVRAKGTRIWDHEGREYLDFLAGFGATNLGHNPPELMHRLRQFLEDAVPNLVHVGPQVHAAELAAELASRAAPLSVCLFSNSGAEAVEAALKLARAATRRKPLLYCKGAFHGTNLGTLSVMGDARLRKPFEPLLPECYALPFGDLAALERDLAKHKAAAFLVEPIQAEAGVVIPPEGYLREARKLCERHGTLMVLDEVQTGIGRTGPLFAYTVEGFVPDVLVLGKSLGGSMVPISATLTTSELHRRAYGAIDRFDLHGSTFSGNAFACRAALATLELFDEQRLSLRSEEMGARLLTGLRDRLKGHPLVTDIRGRGLVVGLELGPTDTGLLNRLWPGLVAEVSHRVFGQWLSVRLLEEGILAQPASQCWNVLKLEPPLTVAAEEIDRVVSTIGEIMSHYRDVGSLLADAGRRLGEQFMGGFAF
jgi:putrescine aminotransferase